jgi:hypothetical protein
MITLLILMATAQGTLTQTQYAWETQQIQIIFSKILTNFQMTKTERIFQSKEPMTILG